MLFLQMVPGLRPPARLNLFCFALAIAGLAWWGCPQPAWASQTTATTLSLTSGGNAVSSVAGGTVVTLTATVRASGAALTLGQVNFCDVAAASCTDIHLVGTAQLTSAGTAVLRLLPGPGSHGYKAVFLGTLNDAPSASAAIGLTVGPRPPGLQKTFTVATISGPDATNSYALTADVGTKGTISPSGTVSFLDTNNGNSLLGTATLGPVSGGTGFLNVPIPVVDSGLADAPPIIAIGDFNGDGIPDIVSAPHGGIAISLGNGDGTFAAPLVIPKVDSADGINAFGVGDFNGDGITDLLVDDEDTGQLTVLLGKGDGTFTVGQTLPFDTQSIAIADFNGDGKLDAALSGVQTTILLGNGDGTFTAAPSQPPITSLQLVAADFNGDGKIDLALASNENNAPFAPTPITILLGNGDGTFTAAPSQPQFVALQLVAADFNGDGKIDLAAINGTGNAVAILLGNGDGTLTAPSTLPTDPNFGLFRFALGDFNGDGKPDVAIAAAPNNPGGNSKVTIFAGNGDGTFAAGFDVNDAFADPLAAADLTGNGSSDLATFGSVFLGNLTIATATVDDALPAGFDIIQADYAGDANSAPSSSTNQPGILVQQQGAQNYTLSNTGATIASPGASGSSTITISPIGNYTGQVTLSCAVTGGPSGAVDPLTCAIPSPISVTGSPVTTTLSLNTQSATTPGSYTVAVTAASTGSLNATTSFTVGVPAVPPALTLSGTAVTIASPGSNGTSTITITPSGGFTGSVALSCAVTGGPTGATDAPTCSVAAPPAITGAAAVSATLTISTTAASTAATGYLVTRNQHPPRGVAIGGPVIAMASLLLFWFPIRRRRKMTQLGLLLIAILIGAANGCGGGTKAAAPPANPGTTPGVYTVTVTGSSGSITATTAVTVTVN